MKENKKAPVVQVICTMLRKEPLNILVSFLGLTLLLLAGDSCIRMSMKLDQSILSPFSMYALLRAEAVVVAAVAAHYLRSLRVRGLIVLGVRMLSGATLNFALFALCSFTLGTEHIPTGLHITMAAEGAFLGAVCHFGAFALL
jgi:hypothetical protein